MMTLLLRALSGLSLALALGACNSAPESSQTQLASGSPSSRPSPIRIWRSDDGKLPAAFLTIYDDDTAKLFIHVPPVNGVAERGLEYASVERVGDRTFLIFFAGNGNYPEIAEIVERPGDRLVVWFHHDLDFEADLIPQLGKLPTVVPPAATELTRFVI